ncbi:MAG: energy transducer TonB [Flavobacteriales bacterium]|nr:energy transducer TonB [Flavobacteriales bacterium]
MKTSISIITTVLLFAALTSTAMAQTTADVSENFQYLADSNSSDASLEESSTTALRSAASFHDAGYSSVEDYFAGNIEFPEKGITKGTRGAMTVWFEILPDGTVGESRIDNSPGTEFDVAVMECLQNMPRWTPARIGAKPVTSTRAVRLNFRLQ